MARGARLLVATTNRAKLREIRAILSGVDIGLEGLEAFPPVPEPEETGRTFAENARQKAVYYSTALGVPVVAEDSASRSTASAASPAWSRRATRGQAAPAYPQKFALVYRGLRERGAMGSPARFVCSLAVADGARIVFEARGTIEGRINDEPAGDGGFGYDPIFFYPPLNRTLAQLSENEKARVSHRGHAFGQLHDYLVAHPALLQR